MTTTRTLDATPTVNGVHVVRVGNTDPAVWAVDDNRMRVRHLAAEHGAVTPARVWRREPCPMRQP